MKLPNKRRPAPPPLTLTRWSAPAPFPNGCLNNALRNTLPQPNKLTLLILWNQPQGLSAMFSGSRTFSSFLCSKNVNRMCIRERSQNSFFLYTILGKIFPVFLLSYTHIFLLPRYVPSPNAAASRRRSFMLADGNINILYHNYIPLCKVKFVLHKTLNILNYQYCQLSQRFFPRPTHRRKD